MEEIRQKIIAYVYTVNLLNDNNDEVLTKLLDIENIKAVIKEDYNKLNKKDKNIIDVFINEIKDLKAHDILITPKEDISGINEELKNKVKEIVNGIKSPNNGISLTDKLSNVIAKGQVRADGNTHKVKILENNGKAVVSQLSLNLDDFTKDNKIALSRELTRYDEAVFNACISLFETNRDEEQTTAFITPNMIYRAMTGSKNKLTVEKSVNKIMKSVRKMSMTRIRIELQEETPYYKSLGQLTETRNTKGYLEGYLLPTTILSAVLSGVHVENAIKILDTPVLYLYAKTKKHIMTYPIEVLNLPVRQDENTIKLTQYLLRQINAIKNKSISNNILYESLYNEINTTDKIQKKRNRIKIVSILEYWKSISFIKDYQENKKGQVYQSITIILE